MGWSFPWISSYFERLSNEGKIERGYQLGRKGKIVKAKNVVTDGPFPESKEAIGGYHLSGSFMGTNLCPVCELEL
jgi:hypothetical protein